MRKGKESSKILGIVFVCMIVGATISESHFVLAAGFGLGDTVEVCNTGGLGLRIRDSPAGNIIGKKYDGDRGVIIEGPQTAALGGIVYTWWRIRWDATTEGWSAEGEPGGVDYLVKVVVVGEPTITASLAIDPSKSEYYVGETIAASFTITNRANVPFVFDVLTAGGRDPDNQVIDFTFRTGIFRNPGESYPYDGTLTLPAKTGNYHFFCAYRRLDGTWNPAIPTEGGATNVLDITVSEQPPPPPPPYYTLTITTTVGGTTNPAPGSHFYSVGAGVDVTAIPYDGYKLDHWKLDNSNAGSANPLHVTMDKDHELLAVFVPAQTMIRPVEGRIEQPQNAFKGYYKPVDYDKANAKARAKLNTLVFTAGFHEHEKVKDGEITKAGKVYSYERWNVYHEGIDVLASRGTQVKAAVSGVILYIDNEVGDPDSDPGGIWIMIQHGDVIKRDSSLAEGISTRYLHLDTISDYVVQKLVENGKDPTNFKGWVKDLNIQIPQGTVVGTVGKTGCPTQPTHLHFEVREGNDFSGILPFNTLPLNPCEFVYYDGFVVPPEKAMQFTAITLCPVDLIITDPDGLVISKVNQTPILAQYIEVRNETETGEIPHDAIIIFKPKIGNYSITVIPEEGAEPADTYNLQVISFNATFVLAENVRISDIPAEPYVFSSTAPECAMSGAVRDKLGNPIPNVLIVAQDASTEIEVASTTSNATGAYAMSVPPSTYNLIVTPPPESGFANTAISNVEVTADTLMDVVLVPAEAVVFGGVVLDRDGLPFAGIRVYVESGVVSKSTVTDENGAFSMQVPPGYYRLLLIREYYDYGLGKYDYFHVEKNGGIDIAEGTVFSCTIQNRLLSGKVQDPNGASVAGVSIYVEGWAYDVDFYSYSRASVVSDSEGDFNFVILKSSSVTLRATPPPESLYSPVDISNIDMTNDKTVIIALTYKSGVQPVADFTWTPETPEVSQSITLDASTSIANSGIIIRHKWSFGDGTYAIGKVVTHSYASPGVYTVTLNVTNSKGLWDIEQKQILVVEPPPGPKPPVASFTFSPANPKVDEGASLDASASVDPDGQIVSYIWNFGDGFTDEGEIAAHSYSKEGNYKVTLTVVDNDGKSSSTSQTVTVVKPTTPTIQTSGLVVIAKSPVDLVIIDPDYFVISKEYSEIPGAVYTEEDLNGDGSPDVYIFIPERKIGQYPITVIPKPDADPAATYTLEVSSDGIAFLLAENVPISDIPTEPYVLYSITFEAPPPPPTYSLTITTTVGGTTDPSPGTYSYTADSLVQVTAIPNADYTFDHWKLDGNKIGSDNPVNVIVDGNHTLRAVFKAFGNQGDLTGPEGVPDGKVDLRDVFLAALAYGSHGPDFLYPGSPSHPEWDERCDLNGDNKVDLKDLYIVWKNYGKIYA